MTGSEKFFIFTALFSMYEEYGMERMKEYIIPMEDALEMILIYGRTGEIAYANVAARTKLEYGEELTEKNISDIFPGTFRIVGGEVETAYPYGQETRNLVAYRKNLTCFPVEARILKREGTDIYLCMANDILEKEYLSREVEQVREEARQALKVKSEFVANVTHELRTPVNGILGNVRELADHVTDDHTIKALRLIERCCGDMNKIINNILDFSKLEAGKFTLEPRRFHFRNMLDYVKSHHLNKITEKGLGFFMTVSPQVPEYVIGDELRIVQILNNLLSNALKFTSVGKITLEVIRTARVNDRIELFFLVKDTGIGVDKGDKEKLLRSFSQVDASISRKYGGTGLGLNICKQLVELMGGTIEVESEKSKGSTFSFSIWTGVCEEDKDTLSQTDDQKISLTPGAGEEVDGVKTFGMQENIRTLQRNLSKLILCVEMDNWEKAEMFMETIRQLTDGAPREVSRKVLRLKMAIQKENYEKTAAEFKELEALIGEQIKGA